MDPNNYKIHKRRAPGYAPRMSGPVPNRVAPQKPTPMPVSPQQSSPRTVQKPVQLMPPKQAVPPRSALMAPKSRMRMASSPPVAPPKPQQTAPQRPKLTPQPIPTRTIATPPKPNINKPDYVFETPNVQSAKKKAKKSKRKKLKLILITLSTLLILGGLVYVGYYYYTHYYKTKPQASQQMTQTNSTSTSFTLYKTKDGSLFKSETKYDDGKQDSKILVANSTKDNRQVVISQQQVDRYFSTDPNGLDKLLQSTGAHDAVSTNNGMSYIVKGGTTAITVRDETLIIIRSTGELKTEEWVDLFNNLENANT